MRDDNSFSVREKLKKRSDFKRLFENGSETYRSKTYRLLVAENSLPYSRLGVVISRKTASAVYRNREKRLVREVFRLNKANIASGYDFIVIVLRKKEMKFEERVGELVGLFRRVSS